MLNRRSILKAAAGAVAGVCGVTTVGTLRHGIRVDDTKLVEEMNRANRSLRQFHDAMRMYSKALESGTMSVNQLRALEGLRRLDEARTA